LQGSDQGTTGKSRRGSTRVVLHVGAPKSGTTFLQRALWSNRQELRRQGINLPGERQSEMFHAAIEVRKGHEFWGYPPEQINGTWAALCKQAREHDGVTVMSHELLGAATPDQVQRALAELEGMDLHVVFTARDLSRQVTSEWQERIKNGSTRSFGKFQRRLVRQIEAGKFSSGFWKNQDAVEVLGRWADRLPPSQVHVVVAPRPGADARELWRRFASAAGFDGDSYDPITTDAPANQALGVAQIAVLRRVNAALDGRIPQPGYARVVKDQFAERLLAAQPSERPAAPARLIRRLHRVAEERNATIRALGYQVHGDLEELVPELPEVGTTPVPPDKVADREVLDAFARAVADMLVQRHDSRAESLLRRAAAVPAAAPLRRRIKDRFRG
jgi:hypothetical protein